MTRASLPFSSSTLRSSASAYLRPSWKMWPISMPRAISSARAAARAGVALAHLGGLDGAVGGEVAAGDEVEDVPAGLVGAGDPAGALDDAGVEEVADAGGRLLAEHLGPDVALDQRGVLREVGLVEGARARRATSAASSRFTSTSRSPGRPTTRGSRVPSGCDERDTTFFSVSAAVQARSSTRGWCALACVDQRLDGRGVGGVLDVRRGRVVVARARRARES